MLGELQGYDEVVNYGALVVASEVRNIHYDALRRQDGNATTKRIKGWRRTVGRWTLFWWKTRV
ncbi:MAG: hypothetical protein IPJ35_03080 [Elusimicrobia bacterium]|nr:hypothetical protein [Elusimicrobiota bacterium]